MLVYYYYFIDVFVCSFVVVINMLDFYVIVIGGGLFNVVSFYDDLFSVIKKYIFLSDCCIIFLKVKFGDFSGVCGVVWLFIL